MDHDTCSARLGPYVRGELNEDDRGLVDAHLAGCADCARELVAVRALMGLEDVQLTPHERRALHRVVLAPRRSRGARWAPALGAAGLLVIVAVGVATGIATTDDAPLETAIEGGTGATQLEQDAEGAGQAIQDQRANKEAGQAADDAVQPAAQDATGTDAAGGSVETFAAESIGVVTTFANTQFGPQLLAYDDAFGEPRRTLRDLDRGAPDRDAASQIRSCAAVVQDAYPFRLRPAFAAVYELDGLLVMGFVFTSGIEQRYAFWGWHLGDCTRPTPIYVTGPLQ